MNTTDDFSGYQDNFVVVHQGADPPEITVVMPVYNCEQFVESAVISVLSQQGVVAEIIISDDASTDDTFACAYNTIINYIKTNNLKHTVSMRAGTYRLKRDHLHLLAKTAACDLICQAHGDDISHSLRCAALLEAFNNEAPTASMIFVSAIVIDQQGKLLWKPKNMSLSNIPIAPVEYHKIILAQDEILIGSNMAWRRSAFEKFPQLSTSYCAYGHDRVMAFRSFLLGSCYFLDAPLLARRLHNNNLHKELISSNQKSINSFNNQLIKLCFFSTIKNDLFFLKENNLIEETRFNQYSKDVDNNISQISKVLTRATSNLLIDGYVNNWIKNS